MELCGKVEGMISKFQALHPVFIGCREDQSCFFQIRNIPRIHLISVPVPLGDLLLPVEVHCMGSFLYICNVITKPHCTAKFRESLLFREKGNYMGTFPKFLARCISNTDFMPGKFDDRQLKPEAEPKERDVIFSGKPDCFYLSLNTSLAKPAGY